MRLLKKRLYFIIPILFLFVVNHVQSSDSQSTEQWPVEHLTLGMTKAEVIEILDHCQDVNHDSGITQIVSCGAGLEYGVDVALDTAADKVIAVIAHRILDPDVDLEKIKNLIINHYGEPTKISEPNKDWRACYGACTEEGFGGSLLDIDTEGKGLFIILGPNFEKKLRVYFRLEDRPALTALGS